MKKQRKKAARPEAVSWVMQIGYWSFFIIVALFLQFFIEGIDAMIVGVFILLPERKFIHTAILFSIFIILQEATGVLTFGTLLFEYTLIIVAFFVGKMVFAVGTFSFVLMLSLFTAILHFILVQIFGAVQGIYAEPIQLIYGMIMQALITPLIWFPMYRLYRRCMKSGNTI